MLSHRIAALRKSKGLSQEQLAERVGVSRQAVSKWETGAASPEFDKLAALSACLGVSVDELVTGVPCEASPKQGRPTARRAGLALCLLGACLLLGAGMAALLFPAAAEQVNASSVLTIRGSGLVMLAALGLAAAGVVLLRRK